MAIASNARVAALVNEGGLAAEAIAFGATVLGRANYAHQGYYAQAFFSLSVGFERCGKLGLALDHALDHGGKFPSAKEFRGYGHDLGGLLAEAEAIAKKRGINAARPATAIHDAITATLSDFATNVTRYYNLEFLAGHPAATTRAGPIESWYRTVVEPIAVLHYTAKQRSKAEARARALEAMAGGIMLVRFFDETGGLINTVYEGSRRTAERDATIPWERMYVLQFGRFFGALLGDLSDLARYTVPDVPYLSEFFATFNNEDSYLRSRKSWTVYER